MAFPELNLNGQVGKPLPRRGGREKVTGTARFAAEWPIAGLLHAVAIPSSIAKGKIVSIDTKEAERLPGVRAILTPDNVPAARPVKTMGESNGQTSLASTVYPATGKEIFYAGQYVGAVIADTFETARDAALLVKIKYDEAKHTTDMDASPADERPKSLFGAPPLIQIGDADKSLEAAEVKIDAEYVTMGNHHNPLEPHTTTAHWSQQDGKPFLTVYDATQSLIAAGKTYAQLFDLKPEQVRVICPFVGGAFGSKISWPHALLAIFCAKLVNLPVKLVVSRDQLYGGVGHRTPIRQRVAIGADKQGTIKSIIHSGVATTSVKDNYPEAFTIATRMMYRAEALKLDQKQCRIDTQSPTFMRAPAETPGMYALESAIDELAVALNMDPIELRIKNEPDKDQYEKKPFSGRRLVDCLREGAQKFGWSKRPANPRATKDGNWLIGTGVAAATYPSVSFPTSARVILNSNGTAKVECCSQEIGTGTETVQSQLLADLLDIPASRVSMALGDTTLPPGGVSGGSATTNSVGGAIVKAVDALKAELIKLGAKNSRLAAAKPDQVKFHRGHIVVDNESIAFEELLAQRHRDSVSALGEFKMDREGSTSNHSFGATFVEVAVDEELGLVKLRRILAHYACGTILNGQTARSQFMGGIIMGIGHALHEQTRWDHRLGRITNDNFADYHVPVNADTPHIDISWINTPDYNASPIGAKGIGEIGITGVAAAIANAIYHATGRRLRRLPMTPEQVMVPD